MIVAEFPLTLCRHPTLCLHHLLYFIGAILEPLGGIKALGVGAGMTAGIVELANGVVALGHGAGEARISCRGSKCLEYGPSHQLDRSKHTVVGIRRTAHHQGHRVPARSSPQLAALDEVVNRPVDLFTSDVSVLSLVVSTSGKRGRGSL